MPNSHATVRICFNSRKVGKEAFQWLAAENHSNSGEKCSSKSNIVANREE